MKTCYRFRLRVKYNKHGFKNRIESVSPTVDRSQFRSGPINWIEKWLNRDWTG